MKILILGGNGQLGTCLKRELPLAGFSYIAPERSELDLAVTKDFTCILRELQPDAVINAAAYTAVDKAESESEMAFTLNAEMPECLAIACKKFDVPLYHISTDYVFSGDACQPYKEDDPLAPISVYGQSKLAGERAVLKQGGKGAIIRTSWLYSEFGHNFYKTILRLSQTKPDLSVVSDQIGTPTYAGDLAKAIVQILICTQHKAPDMDVFHFSNQGVASWYDFAWHILQQTNVQLPLRAIATADYPTPAKRPSFSVLNSTKIMGSFGVKNRHWLEAFFFMLKQKS